jgi:hypothetical protein
MTPQSLSNQRILVIGGTFGIGFATAAEAVDAGAAVTIASRNQTRLDTAAGKLGGAVQSRVIDTCDNNLLERFFQQGQVGIMLWFPLLKRRGFVVRRGLPLSRRFLRQEFLKVSDPSMKPPSHHESPANRLPVALPGARPWLSRWASS